MGSSVIEKTVGSLAEMASCAREWACDVADRHLLLLTGEVGAGKTQFCQFVLGHFGVKDVSSPTFNLIHSYQLPQKTIHHLDLYRLENEEELESIGLWDLFNTPALILVEWGEKLGLDGFEFDQWTVERLHITVSPGGARRLQFETLRS
jgi:tRNA threonylcarbamoyladenosine biosynthesis protein TsaE